MMATGTLILLADITQHVLCVLILRLHQCLLLAALNVDAQRAVPPSLYIVPYECGVSWDIVVLRASPFVLFFAKLLSGVFS